jgi:hypothetical protein
MNDKRRRQKNKDHNIRVRNVEYHFRVPGSDPTTPEVTERVTAVEIFMAFQSWMTLANLREIRHKHPTSKTTGDGMSSTTMTEHIIHCGEASSEFERYLGAMLFHFALHAQHVDPDEYMFTTPTQDSRGTVKRFKVLPKLTAEVIKWAARIFGLEDKYFSNRSLRIGAGLVAATFGATFMRAMGLWSSTCWMIYQRAVGRNISIGELAGDYTVDEVKRSCPLGVNKQGINWGKDLVVAGKPDGVEAVCKLSGVGAFEDFFAQGDDMIPPPLEDDSDDEDDDITEVTADGSDDEVSPDAVTEAARLATLTPEELVAEERLNDECERIAVSVRAELDHCVKPYREEIHSSVRVPEGKTAEDISKHIMDLASLCRRGFTKLRGERECLAILSDLRTRTPWTVAGSLDGERLDGEEAEYHTCTLNAEFAFTGQRAGVHGLINLDVLKSKYAILTNEARRAIHPFTDWVDTNVLSKEFCQLLREGPRITPMHKLFTELYGSKMKPDGRYFAARVALPGDNTGGEVGRYGFITDDHRDIKHRCQRRDHVPPSNAVGSETAKGDLYFIPGVQAKGGFRSEDDAWAYVHFGLDLTDW